MHFQMTIAGDAESASSSKRAYSVAILGYYDLLHVFQYLPRSSLVIAARVCKAWRDAAYDPRLWRECEADLRLSSPSVATADSLNVRGIRAVKMDGNDCDNGKQNVGGFLEALHVNTLIIDMNENSVKPNIPTKSLSTLRCLALTNGVLYMQEELRHLLSPLKQLQQLHMSITDAEDVNDKGERSPLEALISVLPKLKDLELKVCDSDRFLPSSDFTAPNIHRLALSDMAITSETFLNINRCFPQLRHLMMKDNGMDEAEEGEEYDFPLDLKHFINLESVCLGRWECTVMVPVNFLKLFRNSPNITALNLTVQTPYWGAEMDDEDFETIINSLPNLKVLVYGHCASLEALNSCVKKMAHLEVLASIATMFRYHEDIEEATKFIASINQHMPRLISLLDIDVDLRKYGVLDNVKYLTVGETSYYWYGNIGKRVRKVTSQPVGGSGDDDRWDWEIIPRGSADWHEAVATKHFQLLETYYLGLMDWY